MDGGLPIDAETRAAALSDAAGGLDAQGLMDLAVRGHFPGRIAVVSSFGAEAALLLDLVARADPATPVIFLETGKHFPETLRYRDRLVAQFGLTDVRSVRPDPADLSAQDPDGRLWAQRPDRCCHLRKVLPLARALGDFDAWVTGRKRYQATTRRRLPRVETADGRVKLNPLADWTEDDVDAAFCIRDLPRHPLVDEGYPSIGCLPCTRRVSEGEGGRAGRWAGLQKTECGIHKAWWAREGGGGDI
jgi:phosphoadenosine phosphosulfate reductase